MKREVEVLFHLSSYSIGLWVVVDVFEVVVGFFEVVVEHLDGCRSFLLLVTLNRM